MKIQAITATLVFISLVCLIKPSTPGIESQEPITQLPHLHSLLESCQPQPAAVNQPQPADILQTQSAGIHQQQPTGVHQPQPAGVHQPQPAGVHQQQPTGVNQPQPAGIHQSMLVNNKNPLRVTDDGTLTSILFSRFKIAYICYELFVYYHTYRHFCGIKFCSTVSKHIFYDYAFMDYLF